jgi:hypothetical protein
MAADSLPEETRAFPSQLRMQGLVVAELIETSPLKVKLHKFVLDASDLQSLHVWLDRVLLYKPPSALPPGLVTFADKRVGCPVCGVYANENGEVTHNAWWHEVAA